jgi:hypothetical protein
VLSPPAGLAEDTLTGELSRQWGVAVASIDYRAVGFGSHHWTVTDPGGGRWFATVDELGGDPGAYDRLERALGVARALYDSGAEFVVAPVPTAGGHPVARLGDRFALSLFPFVDGDSFGFGGYSGGDHRDGVLAMVVRVHGASRTVRARATVDDLAIESRAALEAALAGVAPAGGGPYTERAAELISEHASEVRRRLARYDRLVAGVERGRAVLTHGEPHPGNTLRTRDGWRLIDWDTVRIAPPERDLWHLGGDLSGYTEATGTEVLEPMLALYELRWALTDLALGVELFRRTHGDSPNEQETWQILRHLVGGM